jgi:hypothetical protein
MLQFCNEEKNNKGLIIPLEKVTVRVEKVACKSE